MRYLICAVVASVGIVSAPAFAQAAPPPVEAYGMLPDIVGAEMSPDGDRIALLTQTAGGMEVRIYDIAGNTYSHRFDAGDLKAHDLSFADNDHILLSASQTARSDFVGRYKYEFDGKIAVNLETNRSMQLLSREDSVADGQRSLGQVVGQLENGQLLMSAFQEFKNGVRRVDLLRADPDSGRGFTHAVGDLDTIDWFVDRDGNPLVREKYDAKRNLYTLELSSGGSWKVFYEAADVVLPPMQTVAVTPDDDGLYYIADEASGEPTDDLRILRFDGTSEPANLAMEGFDIEAMLRDRNRHLLGVRYAGALPDYAILDPDLRTNYRQVRSALSNTAIQLDSWSRDRSRVLYRVFDGQQVDYWLINDSRTSKMTALAPSRSAIPASAVGKVYALNYPARDGFNIPAMVTLPPGQAFQAGMKLPMIVLPHGGPASYDSVDFDWLAQFFASRGYLVLQPNFRGSTGYGQAHLRAGRGEWGGKMQDDISDGIEAMVEEELADPDRVCIVGASYGGYAALAGGAFTPELYTCIAAFARVTNLPALLAGEKRQAYQDQLNEVWRRSVGTTVRSELEAISPVSHATAFRAPVLLIHGDDDTVVPAAQSRDMKQALERAGKSVELVRLDGGDHWLSDSDTRLQTLRALDTFIGEHLPVATRQTATLSPSVE